MPNHVTNILVVSGDGEQRQAMFEAIKSDEHGLGSLDFNKVIPMPEHIFRGSLGQEERAKFGSANFVIIKILFNNVSCPMEMRCICTYLKMVLHNAKVNLGVKAAH